MKANSSLCTEQTANTTISEDENDRSSNTLLHNYYPLEEEEDEVEEENHNEKENKWIQTKGKTLDRSWHSSAPSLINVDTKSVATAPHSFDHLTNEEALRLHQEMLMKWRMEHHLNVSASKDESHFYFNEVAMTSDQFNEDDASLINIRNNENSPSQRDGQEKDNLKTRQIDSKKTRKENFKNKIQKRLLKRSSKSHDRGSNDMKNSIENSLSSSDSSLPILLQSDSSNQNSPEKDQESFSEQESSNDYSYFELSPCASEISSKHLVPAGTQEIITCLKNMENKATIKNLNQMTINDDNKKDDDDKKNIKSQKKDLNKNDKSFVPDQASQLPPTPPTDESKQTRRRSSKKSKSDKKMSKSKNSTFGDNVDVISKGRRIKSPIKSTLYYDNEAFLRLSRQSRRGSFRQKTNNKKQTNYVRLHIYDLLASETYVEFPWGCAFPIGKCLNAVNTGLHALGTGAYHCGIEVNGVEYAFGANQIPGLSGVFTCEPMKSPGYEYRTTLDFGERYSTRKFWITVPKTEYINTIIAKNKSSSGQENHQYDDSDHQSKSNKGMDFTYRQISLNANGLQVMREMAGEYMGVDYDLLRKNCCTFARDACLRLGVKESEIPTWFMNIAKAGAQTEDTIASMEKAMFTPLHKIMSCNREKNNTRTDLLESGFEVIVRNAGRGKKSIHIIESNVTRLKTNSKLKSEDQQGGDDISVGVRETLSWTY